MKKIIVSIALVLTAALTQAQNSLFNNISTTEQYQEYWSVYDAKGDGVYTVTKKRFLVTFQTEYLATGEGYKIEAVIESEGVNKGSVQHRYDATDNYYLASGYPYESILKHKYLKNGFVSMGDYVLLLSGISEDGTSFEGIDKIYIKKGAATPSKEAEAEKVEKPKKKKMSFKERIMALKTKATGVANSNGGIKIKDLRKNITDYLVAMKAKQDARTSAELKGDKNIIAARERGDADIKKYNDSIKATPEYKKTMAFHKRRDGEQVTINNETGRTIYVFRKGDDRTFSGTEVWDNGSTKLECDQDYSYSFSKKGSGIQCYTANTACGNAVTVE